MKDAKPAAPTLDDSTRLLKAFADPVRLRLLNLLTGDAEVCVCHLHEALGLPQPTVPRHLAYLRKYGLVVGRKEGLWVHYRLAKPETDLHRTLIGGVGPYLGDNEVVLQDPHRWTGTLTISDALHVHPDPEVRSFLVQAGSRCGYLTSCVFALAGAREAMRGCRGWMHGLGDPSRRDVAGGSYSTFCIAPMNCHGSSSLALS
jgi:ArsR family transcriptional regulator